MHKIGIALLMTMILLPGISLAQTFRIDEVTIEGLRRVDPSILRSVISVEAGETVSPMEIDQDIRAIFKLGRFDDVSADVEERGRRNVLVYRVSERPLVRKLEFAGNKKLDDKKLSDLMEIKVPAIYDPRQVDKAVAAVRNAYVEEGFYAVEVVPGIDVDEGNEAVITFRIEEGSKVLIDQIRFEGNQVFTDRQLKKFMETKERWFLTWLTERGTYNEEVLQNDLEIVADQYYNLGHVQVRVKQPQIALSPDRKLMDVLIEIEEGEQFRVGKVDVQGDLILSREELLAMVKLGEGDIFNRRQLRDDVLSVNNFYADRGYAYVNVSPLTHVQPEERAIDLVFDIEQGIQVSIDRIRIRGNTKTRDKVIRREMTLVEGDLYSASQLKESRRRVNNLGFFDEVNVTTSKGDDPAEMNVDVEVKERPTGTFSVGLGYSSVDGIIGQGSISQENFLGRSLKLNLAGSFGSRSTTYQIGVTDPYFLDTRLTLGFDLYKTEREWSDFTKKALGGDIKVGYPLTDKVRTFFVYRYEEKEILDVDLTASDLIRDQEGESTLSSVYASIIRDTTDFRLDPTRGYMSTASIEYAGLGGTEKFAKYEVDHRHFFPWKWGTVFSAHGHLGYVQGLGGEDIPIDERFFLGGINTIRGFQTREVGPRVRQVIQDSIGNEFEDFEYVGGDKAAYFNFEYTFPLVREMGLKGLLFFDAGNAWEEDQDFFNDLRYSAGGGIRWFSPMGPLRLEWGYNLDPREGEDRSQFEFSIGKFF